MILSGASLGCATETGYANIKRKSTVDSQRRRERATLINSSHPPFRLFCQFLQPFSCERSMVTKFSCGLLLDLDQTLVITQPLESLRNTARKTRNWNPVYQAFHKTYLQPYTESFVAQVSQLATVGVVTNSPRPYAERLLAHHGLDLRVLVGYRDVRNHKPHPEPILRGAELLGIPVENCIHVGDSATDIEASLRARAITVGVAWGSPNGQPHAGVQLWAKTWEEVLQFIRELVGVKRNG
jgi:HAD superfamily hydrolase (TIGR01549 family)